MLNGIIFFFDVIHVCQSHTKDVILKQLSINIVINQHIRRFVDHLVL